MDEYPTESIRAVVERLTLLPGIGKKTALRLALHLLKLPEAQAQGLGQAIGELQQRTRRCVRCHNLSDAELCHVCSNPRREQGTICVVEESRELLAIERTGQYRGLYHVLGGLISPMDGIGPEALHIESLLQRAALPETQEVIFALPASMEGETTAFYLARQLGGLQVELSNIARGIPLGSDLEYTDELTLARSLQNRTAYHSGMEND